MIEALTKWHYEHLRFGRLLDILDRQLAAFHMGEDPDYELMRDIVDYLQNFASRFHHPREDEAFRRLTERDPGMRMLVNRLLQEHRVIATAGVALLEQLSNIEEDVILERAKVEAAVGTYLVYYRHHLTMEESAVLPRAAEILAAEDWAAVAAAVPPGRDPLFGPELEARYEELRRHVAPETYEA